MDLPDPQLLSRGKVRDIYATSSPDHLLFVATERISVYDVILNSVRGSLNSFLPDFMCFASRISQARANSSQASRCSGFEKLTHIIPNHLVTVQQYREQLEERLAKVLVPMEAIIIHRDDFVNRAEQGTHDENISPEKSAQPIGQDLFGRIQAASLQPWTTAAEYAESCGLILIYTKFEFGLVTSAFVGKDKLILMGKYEPDQGQSSFDKQYVRNALTAAGYTKG
ncbi:uncharacterized protein BJ212DRAFT_1447928 [Suillus subaureus]|uniref:Phosphoribosylaminoimidazole-succinocarboxamide synthase n=1 Tax=Suillus subaureus TaxID=48587 RepID=A0A9P7E851_9AGAM|nr:uncharacterized protein BJ212DRAFT_1447928 [Suillus subaureus]KAG1813261.1 hypothetical protein BJ212DRAFT_1447928 [Suillus subaureus]